MQGEIKSVYYKDLTQEEKDFVNNAARQAMLKKRENFIKDARYTSIDPEDIWYLKLNYIHNWKYEDNNLLTKCECGSLEFDCLKDVPARDGLSRDCLYRCCKCGKTHQEWE